MSSGVDVAAWPLARAGEALEALASRADLGARDVEVPAPPAAAIARGDAGALGAWVEHAAAWLGVEAEAVDAPWPELAEMLAGCAPALVLVPPDGDAGPRLVALLARARGGVVALGPDLRARVLDPEDLRAALCAAMEAPLRAGARALLASAEVPAGRRRRAEDALVRQRLASRRVGGCWLLREDPGAPLARQLRRTGATRRLAGMLAAQLALYAASGLAWYVLGRGALEGTLDRAWLWGWAIALLTTVPLQLAAAWHGARLAVDAGGVFKRRLLAGAARLDPAVVRHEGVGGLLGRVIESSAVEQGALTGAATSLAAAPAVALALATLAAGPAGWAHAGLYALWVALGVAAAARYARPGAWTVSRVAMTNDLVERIVGHRTRVAQESPARWHDGEDKAVDRHLASSARLDRAQVALQVLVPRGWTALGLAALSPAIVSGAASTASLAVGVGAVLFAGAALRAVTAGLVGILSAGIAWREVAPLFAAAGRRDAPGVALFARPPPAGDDASTRPVLEAADVVYRHEGRAEPVLRGASLRVHRGDRILLEGASGGGKSTLGAVLAGLRAPASGLLLLHGLDARSVGATAWRRRVVAAPQFHENHVMTHTLAFNLLLGRAWPPREEDLAEAEAVCRELGLGPLLDRMPSGLQQVVGESGWRLSHGEQSRIFMARALLQGAEVVVLDESLAALDPESLRAALECAFRRCPALVLIAHP